MNAPSVDIREILESYDESVSDSSSLGLNLGVNLFVGKEPATPDNCVTIFDTPGFPPQLTFDNAQFEYPSVQIRVRNRDYRTGWAMANDIKDALHGLSQQTWNSTLYSVITCSSGPALLDWDDNNRVRFIVNFNIQRRAG